VKGKASDEQHEDNEKPRQVIHEVTNDDGPWAEEMMDSEEIEELDKCKKKSERK